MGKPCLFQCSMFWAFSLWLLSILTTSRRSNRFDAQCSELFLYRLSKNLDALRDLQGFDAQCFELFLYNLDQIWNTSLLRRFRCSMFWAFSLFYLTTFIRYHLNLVSMLNVLSFFFINWNNGVMVSW